jgi:hypothetical protein
VTGIDGVRALSPAVPEFDWDALPLTADRGVGWKALRDKGRVLYSQGWYHLTHREDVTFALRNPELFSSGPAYNGLGSPSLSYPSGSIRRNTRGSATSCSRSSARHCRDQPRRCRRHLGKRPGDGWEGLSALGLRRGTAPLSWLALGSDGADADHQRVRVPDFELAPGFVPDVTFPAPTLGLDRLPLVFTRA